MTLPRLSPSYPLPAGVIAPAAIPESVGIVHLGWGAFHRAHQALYTQEAMEATGDLSWGILGDVERTPALVPALREQGGRYSVLEVGTDETGQPTAVLRVVASVLDVAYPGDETPRLLAAMAAPSTRVITLTVTEKGYCRLPNGKLDLNQVAADIAAFNSELLPTFDDEAETKVAPAQTAIGLLVRGLLARYLAGKQPVTVLSCDNMAHNGKVLRSCVDQFLEAAAEIKETEAGLVHQFQVWLDENTTWPSSMVDRITPATTPEVLTQIEALLGARDEAGVVAEPFRQWVIEDEFAGDRPHWELAGAEFVDDVAPWEEAKLRMLNGTHSVLAYAGRVLGYPTMAEAMAAPEIAKHARAYLFDDAVPSVTVPEGADLQAYGEELLHRFANPATGHTTKQVSTDGSQKIPFRWGAAAEYSLAHGRVPQGIAFGLAAWSEFVRRAVRDGVDLGDPASAETLTSIVHDAGVDSPETVAKALLTLPGLLPDHVGTNPELLAAVVDYAANLAAHSETIV